jgi:hypothetical protein
MFARPPSVQLTPALLAGRPLGLRAGVRAALRLSRVVRPVGFVQRVRPSPVDPAAATRPRDAGSALRAVQERRGQANVEPTMVSTPVLNQGGCGGTSLLAGR